MSILDKKIVASPYLPKEIDELRQIIKTNKEEIAALRGELEAVEGRVDTLEQA